MLYEVITVVSPFIIFSILIHIYVQNWVLDENERGFHFVGGLVRNATWFIYVLGLIASIFNLKVKYLPTPKEMHKGSQLIYVVPNLIVALLSSYNFV